MQGKRDDVPQSDLLLTAEIQAAIRTSFERHAVKPSVRVMALFSLLIETFGLIDWKCEPAGQEKGRRDMSRMAARLTELAKTKPGTMRLEQVRTADVVGV